MYFDYKLLLDPPTKLGDTIRKSYAWWSQICYSFMIDDQSLLSLSSIP